MKTAVAVNPALPAVQQNTPMAMLAAAVAKGVDTEQLSKLMELQERWEKNEARKAFADAMVEFKAIDIQIERNKDVAFGQTKYSHATLDNVCRKIISALQSVGIAHSWKVEQIEGKVRVSCVLRHRAGHEETVSLEGAPDASGQKNPIQQIASTVSYLERYTLLASTGLAVGIEDTDGRADTTGRISDQQFADFEAAVESASDTDALATLWKTIAAACNKAKDRESYGSLKNSVKHKGVALKEAA